MELFSAEQRRVLNYAWIPGLLISFFFIAEHVPLLDHLLPVKTLGRSGYAMRLAIPFSWPFFWNRKWWQGVVMLLAALAVYLPFYLTQIGLQWMELIYFAMMVVLCAVRHALQEQPYAWGKVLLMALLLMCVPYLNNLLGNFIHPHTDTQRTWMDVTQSLLTGIPQALLFFVFFFMFDNFHGQDGYPRRLASKIALIDHKHFMLLFVMCNTAFFASLIRFGDAVFFRHPGSYADLFMFVLPNLLECIPLLFFSGWLLRNTVMCRMATVNKMDRIYTWASTWPVLNLVPFFSLMDTDHGRTTPEDNALRYLEPRPANLRVVIIILYVLGCLGHLVSILSMGGGRGIETLIILSMAGMTLARAILWVVNYTRNTLAAIMVLTMIEAAILTVALIIWHGELDEAPARLLLALVLFPWQYYMFQEIFHPALHDGDAITYHAATEHLEIA